MYSIRIINSSNVDQDYFMFHESPIVSGARGKIFTNAWVAFPRIPNHANACVTFSNELYAYWGTSTKRLLKDSTVFNIGQGYPLSEGSCFKFKTDPCAHFVKTNSDKSDRQFTITSGKDFTNPSPYVFGIGKLDRYGMVSPIATFTAEPSAVFNITHREKIWISTGDYIESEVLDIQQIGEAIAIDFSDRAERTAVATQLPNGTYTVKYFV